jgi:integrase
MRMADIEPRDVKRFTAHVAGRGVSANTVRLALAPVKALFATALEDGVVRTNPTLGVRVPRREAVDEEGEEHAKALTEDELGALIAAVPVEHRLFVEFLAHTGVRVSEGLAVQWRDLDLGRRRLMVRRRIYHGHVGPPKSRHGKREVPLTVGMARSLWERRKAAPGAQASDYVFSTRAGTPYDRANLAKIALKPAARAAGVPWAGWHTLRHTCASVLFRNGVNVVQVSRWLGHSSPSITMDVYISMLPGDIPEAPFLNALTGVTRG